MSRSYKDSRRKYHFKDYWTLDWIPLEGYGHRLGKTSKPKLRKEVDTEDHWMSTPSWWTRLVMNRPQRRAGRLWERKVLFEDIEETDSPGVSHRPHIYYY